MANEKIIKLRSMNENDWPLTLAWRSLYSMRGGAYTQKTFLKWEEHFAWMQCRGRWWRFFIIQIIDNNGTRPIGVINIGQLDNWNPEFNYYLGELSLNNQDIGVEALRIGIDWLRKHGYMKCHTTIPDSNTDFIEIMKILEFTNIGKARLNESTWEKYIREKDEATEYTSGRKPFMGID